MHRRSNPSSLPATTPSSSSGARSRASEPLHRRIAFDTPEHVSLEYVLADLGSRVAAFLLDICMLLAGALALGLVGGFLIGLPAIWGAAEAVVYLAIFLLQWGYFLLFEGLTGGRTPGKRALGLRVIHATGESLSFQGAVLRNLLRVVDLQPGVGVVGAVSILATSRAQRLGDLVAGTIVVRDEAEGDIIAAAPLPDARQGRPLLSPESFELLSNFIARRTDFRPAVRARVAASVDQALSEELGDPKIELPRVVEERLSELHRIEAPRHAAARPDASVQASLLVKESREDWIRYAALVRRARASGLGALSEDEIRDFGRLYRGMTADLARTHTYRASPGLSGRLRRWVGAGHNLLYQRRRQAVLPLVRFVVSDFPCAFRRYWKLSLLAGVLFYGSGTATFLLARADPAFGRAMSGPSMLTRAENTERDDIEARYVEVDPGVSFVSQLMTNNISVALLAFAAGALAGLGTFTVLVANGVVLGAVLGSYFNEGVGGVILAFVFPHGFIELTAICISGGAGFGLASALFAPGRRTRTEALMERGRSFLVLIGGVSLMLVVAALIEGLYSPSTLPAASKFAFGGATVVLLGLYLGFSGRGRARGGADRRPIPPGPGSAESRPRVRAARAP